MVTPRVALTAAHCIEDGWDGIHNPNYDNIELTDSVPNAQGESTTTTYKVQEIRMNECYDSDDGVYNSAPHDIAIMILEEEKPNAVEGVDYIPLWYGDKSIIEG